MITRRKRPRKVAVQISDLGDPTKPKNQWVTGDEPMTPYQASYLRTLSELAHVDFDPSLTKRQASYRIEELQALTGRGRPKPKPKPKPPARKKLQ